MLTRRGWGLTLGAGALWVAARSLGVAELQLAAVAALVLVVASLLLVLASSGRIEVDRVVRPAVLAFDGEAVVELQVRNAGRLPTTRLDVRDHVPDALGGSHTVAVPPLRADGRTSWQVPIRGHQRGRTTVGPCRVRWHDPFGLTARTRVLGGTTPVTVHPRVWTLPPGVPLGGATASGRDGRRRTTPTGQDLADIREYVRGDDLRTVHWPSTAHRGKLMVRRAETPEAPRAVVALDLRVDRHLGEGSGASIETAVSAAASAGFHLTARGRSVALVDAPLDGPATTLPWEAWLERLADARPTSVATLGLLQQIGQGLAGDGTLLLVHTVPPADELRALVRAGRGFSTRLALLVDAASHAPTRRARTDDPDPVSATAALQAAGWRVACLRAREPVDAAWRQLVLQRRLDRGSVA